MKAKARREHSARAVWLRGGGAKQVVRLVQREASAALMAGMWELPNHAPETDEVPEFTVRHSITVTNHVIDVYRKQGGPHGSSDGEWVPVQEMPRRPLTGLTRKILRRMGLMD